VLHRGHLGEQPATTSRRSKSTSVVAVAVDAEEHLGLDLAKRSTTERAPKSGEQLDQIAPIDAVARNAITASAMLGR
jgi:hypothetical protein